MNHKAQKALLSGALRETARGTPYAHGYVHGVAISLWLGGVLSDRDRLLLFDIAFFQRLATCREAPAPYHPLDMPTQVSP